MPGGAAPAQLSANSCGMRSASNASAAMARQSYLCPGLPLAYRATLARCSSVIGCPWLLTVHLEAR
jgi:hypothetical protein